MPDAPRVLVAELTGWCRSCNPTPVYPWCTPQEYAAGGGVVQISSSYSDHGTRAALESHLTVLHQQVGLQHRHVRALTSLPSDHLCTWEEEEEQGEGAGAGAGEGE